MAATQRGHRNDWLRLDDGGLLKQCREERYRASGPGGQRRNKVETAIRLHHAPSGVVSNAEESRSLAENRKRALRRLRERIAITCRQPIELERPLLPQEVSGQVKRDGRLAINPRNRVYPLIVATALDVLAAADGSYAKAARALGLTTSQLIRLLRSDPHLKRALDVMRAHR